jgi:outer membrane protein assembly factor BamB
VSVALIELDLDAAPAPPPSRPPARYFRFGAVLACAVLVLALGGAAPAASVLWRRAGLVPLDSPATTYQLVGGLLYTIDSNDDHRTTTAWSMDPVRKLWSVSTPRQVDESGSVIQDGASVGVSGGYTLLQSSSGITIVDPKTGRIRWRAPQLTFVDDGEVAVVQRTEFAPGTLYDQSSGDPGPLYFSEDGVPHDQPPERTVLHGFDLGTGRERWTVSEPGSVYVVPAAGDGSGFVLVTADRLALLASDTGAVVREHALPHFAAGDISYPEVMGDLLILRHDISDTGAGTATMFGLDTLTQRWEMTEAGRDGGGSCVGLLCGQDGDRLAVLDPATGAPRWYLPRVTDLSARDGGALEMRGMSDTPLYLRDARTGQIKVDLNDWQSVAESADDSPIVVFRFEPPAGRAGFGVVLPGADHVQPLGLSTDRITQCSADGKYVACRTLRGIEVWAYQA